ncbi:histidine phosphatase family protein [Schaalia sp. 19OD2882]|uniref:histidine phosphatase family protein n=1 Tax=Schaalia sp. 19OD2882 TaxID=2794089 RepID=UPI001C1F051A|nr:histidine phosphatase family protein [Schaalia sp. 19OD2882]QWW20462.1 histidine phosphatase family protein [Schaalia sp. 19OD2882]
MNSSGPEGIRLVLVRHGRTLANVSGALDTALPGLPLDEVGRGQAAHLARRWVHEVGPLPSVVAVSALERTRMTAAPLVAASGAKAFVRHGIREVVSGDIEMDLGEVSARRYHRTVAAWVRGDLSRRMPGGEDGREVLARALPVVAEVVAETARGGGEVGVIVAHGSLVRFLAFSLAPGLGAERVLGTKLENTGTACVDVPVHLVGAPGQDLGGACVPLSWNDMWLDPTRQSTSED